MLTQKRLIWLGMGIGSVVFGLIPLLWGEQLFSFTALMFNSIGGLLGIWFGYKVSKYF